MAEDKMMDYSESDDFYSLLALQRDPPPTESQIRSAYRRLSRSFHPDKQAPELRDAATRQYDRIRVAHDTLVDPHKRVVYDMLGEEGVRAEWGAGGTMGTSGEAEKQGVGVKAMDAIQFKRWFLMTMKRRERKTVEDMVQAKGLVRLHVDARPLFFREATHPDSPVLRPTSLALGLNFTTPFQLFKWIQKQFHYETRDEGGEQQENGNLTPLEAEDETESLRIHASVGGQFKPMVQKVSMINEDTGEEESQVIDLPPALFATNVSLGASLETSMRGVGPNRSTMDRLLYPILGDSTVQLGALALPEPSIQGTVNKSITLVKNTFPLNLGVQARVVESPLLTPPSLSVSASRNFSPTSLMYGSWASGTLSWPDLIQSIFALAVTPTPKDGISQLAQAQSGEFQLGFFTVTRKSAKLQIESEAEDDDGESFETEDSESSADIRTTSEPLQSWGVSVQNSAADLRLSVTYTRKLFADKAEEPKLSEWNLEGYHPNQNMQSDRSVRLHVNTSVNADLSFGWSVTGTRRFGEFSQVGLGVGIEGQMGLVVSLTWRRLGQSIKLPVVLCPLEYAKDVAPLAVIVPWLTFSAVEFGFLRPRQRRKRRQLLSKQSKKLKRVVAKRKRESQEAVNLMRDQVKRRQAKEFAKDGLVILHAEYGHDHSLSDSKSGEIEPETREQLADVTIPLAALVDQSQLSIPSKVDKDNRREQSQILGFYDPAPLLPKTLRVRYRFDGKEHSVEVNDSEALMCPMRSHML